MIEIKLANSNIKAMIDDEDFEIVNAFTWRITKFGYVVAKGDKIRMHRMLMNTPDGMVTDHINGIRHDNRRCNLRVCTNSENMRNRKMQSNNKSGFRGVHQKKSCGLWYAQIKIDGVQKHLGAFRSPEKASEVYEKEAVKVYGDFKRK